MPDRRSRHLGVSPLCETDSTSYRGGHDESEHTEQHSRERPPAKRKGRADYGAPIDGYFEKLTPDKRAPLDKLRSIVEATVPSAQSR